MNLVIVSGFPASGKSTVAKKVADILRYEFLSKDIIKEQLFDQERRTTHDYLWYEKKANEILFDKVQKAVSQNKSVVVESNFMGTDKKRFDPYKTNNVSMVEVYCSAKGFTSLKRYVRRNETGRRHHGHHDRRWYVLLLLLGVISYSGVKWPYGPLNIAALRMDVDTTDFSKVDYRQLAKRISEIH